MKKSFVLLGTLGLFAMAGCGDSTAVAEDPNLLVNANFDGLIGWVPETMTATLTREKAHSAPYSLKVDATHEYSLTYSARLGSLSATRPKRVKLSAWVWLPTSAASANLVLTVSNPATPTEKALLWEGLPLGKMGAVGKWTEISKVIAMPDNALPTYNLSLYLWRTSGTQAVYVDDLRVAIVE